MDLFNFDPNAMLSFLLTFMRVSLVLFVLPVFETDGLPAQWKAALCLVLTMAIWPTVSLSGTQMPAHPFDIALILLGEVVLGLILGLALRFFSWGFRPAGN